MTENLNEMTGSVSINKILVAILNKYGTVEIPTLEYIDTQFENTEIVMQYDDGDVPSFIFSVRNIDAV